MPEYRNIKRWLLFNRALDLYHKKCRIRDVDRILPRQVAVLYTLKEVSKVAGYSKRAEFFEKLKHVQRTAKFGDLDHMEEKGWIKKEFIRNVAIFSITPFGVNMLDKIEKYARLTRFDK